MIRRCWKCGGRKEIVGMGNIRHKCPECEGIGSVEVWEETITHSVLKPSDQSPVETPETPPISSIENDEPETLVELMMPFRKRGRPRRPNKVIDIS